jgi:hypothetical protein
MPLAKKERAYSDSPKERNKELRLMKDQLSHDNALGPTTAHDTNCTQNYSTKRDLTELESLERSVCLPG